jgi:hypothetical protein
MHYFSKLTESQKKIVEKYDTFEGTWNISTFRMLDYFYEANYPEKNVKYSFEFHKIAGLSRFFLHENISRSLLLYKSFINGISSKNPLQTTLACRAQYETCGSLTYLHKKYNQYLKNTIPAEKIHADLLSLLKGARDKPELPPQYKHLQIPDAIGVMTLIDSGDYFFKQHFKSKGIFRDQYNRLSEICHPNGPGYSLHSIESLEDYKDPEAEFDEDVYSTGDFLYCMIMYMECYKILSDLTAKND